MNPGSNLSSHLKHFTASGASERYGLRFDNSLALRFRSRSQSIHAECRPNLDPPRLQNPSSGFSTPHELHTFTCSTVECSGMGQYYRMMVAGGCVNSNQCVARSDLPRRENGSPLPPSYLAEWCWRVIAAASGCLPVLAGCLDARHSRPPSGQLRSCFQAKQPRAARQRNPMCLALIMPDMGGVDLESSRVQRGDRHDLVCTRQAFEGHGTWLTEDDSTHRSDEVTRC